MRLDPELKRFRAIVRKALRDGTLTEKELIAFIRSRRLNGKNHPYPKAEVMRIDRSDEKDKWERED